VTARSGRTCWWRRSCLYNGSSFHNCSHSKTYFRLNKNKNEKKLFHFRFIFLFWQFSFLKFLSSPRNLQFVVSPLYFLRIKIKFCKFAQQIARERLQKNFCTLFYYNEGKKMIIFYFFLSLSLFTFDSSMTDTCSSAPSLLLWKRRWRWYRCPRGCCCCRRRRRRRVHVPTREEWVEAWACTRQEPAHPPHHGIVALRARFKLWLIKWEKKPER